MENNLKKIKFYNNEYTCLQLWGSSTKLWWIISVGKVYKKKNNKKNVNDDIWKNQNQTELASASKHVSGDICVSAAGCHSGCWMPLRWHILVLRTAKCATTWLILQLARIGGLQPPIPWCHWWQRCATKEYWNSATDRNIGNAFKYMFSWEFTIHKWQQKP